MTAIVTNDTAGIAVCNALQRENAKQLQTIRIQAVTIEALRAELAALKTQPVQEPPCWCETCCPNTWQAAIKKAKAALVGEQT